MNYSLTAKVSKALRHKNKRIGTSDMTTCVHAKIFAGFLINVAASVRGGQCSSLADLEHESTNSYISGCNNSSDLNNSSECNNSSSSGFNNTSNNSSTLEFNNDLSCQKAIDGRLTSRIDWATINEDTEVWIAVIHYISNPITFPVRRHF